MSQKITSLIIFFSFIFVPAFSQSTPQVFQETFYVQCPDLDFEKYRQLDIVLKGDGHFTIATACIPAHVLTVVVNNPSSVQLNMESEFSRFRNFCIASGIDSSTLLGGYTKQMFEEQCRSARTGN
jgi:hypothetical protein